MTKFVWVLARGYNYEGTEPVFVFASEPEGEPQDLAKQFLTEEEAGYGDYYQVTKVPIVGDVVRI